MADALEGRAYRPIDAGSDGGSAAILRIVLSLVAAASLLLFVWPAALRFVAPLAPLADPARAGLVRLSAFGAFAVSMLILSIARQGAAGNRRREVWVAFASEVGGSVRQAPYQRTPGGFSGGPEVEFSVGPHRAILSCAGLTPGSRSSSSHHTRLATTAALVRDFQFQILPNTPANRVLMSPNIWKPILAAARRQAEKGGAGGAQVSAVDRVAFLADAAVGTGDAELDRTCLVKSTDEGLVRDLLGNPGVRSALAALQAADRGWRVTLLSVSAAGPAQLEVEVPGWDSDLPRLRAMREVLKATLDRLEDQRVIGRAAA